MKYRYLSIFLIILILAVGAVSAQENTTTDSDVNVLQDSATVASSEHIIDDSNYDTYFNSTTGSILETANISDGDTIKFGDITNKTFVFDRSLTITSNSSSNVIRDSTFSFGYGSDFTLVTNLTISNQNFTGIAIGIGDTGFIVIENCIIKVYSAENTDSVAIYADSVDNLRIIDNQFIYQGNTNGTAINKAVLIVDSDEVVIDKNDFLINIPSCDVKWIPDGSGGYIQNAVSEGIVVDNSTIKFNENFVNVEYNNVTSASGYDTIYSLDFNVNTAEITNNTIISSGYSVIYGITIKGLFAISNNTIMSASDSFYANGIDVEGTTDEHSIVYNNTIIANSPVVAYPVYSSMSGSDVNAYYINNTICGLADIIYGMELAGTNESVVGNTIILEGNKTTGIAAEYNYIEIVNNNITVNGVNLGNTTTKDHFVPFTTALNLYKITGYIVGNNFESTSNGIIATLGDGLIIVKNNLKVYDNGLDDSFGIYLDYSTFGIHLNNITYVGNSNGTNTNAALYILDAVNVNVTDNIFDVEIPSLDVSYDAQWNPTIVSQGVFIEYVDGLYFTDNNIVVSYNDYNGTYDSIYAVNLFADNSIILNNTIFVYGHTYAYGITATGENVTLEYNTIDVCSDGYYAAGITYDGEGSYDTAKNVIILNSPGVAYGVRTSAYSGNLTAEIGYHEIVINSPISYGIYLAGTNDVAGFNRIILTGNYTMGVASSSNNATICANTIIANGSNVGNASTSDSIKPETIGVKVVKGIANVSGNDITSTGTFTVNVTDTNSSVTYNYLLASILYGDDSVCFNGSAFVCNNTPQLDMKLVAEDVLMFYRNGTRYVVYLTTLDGKTPYANKTLAININGVDYIRTTDENGSASMAINLAPGIYSVSATYVPGAEYLDIIAYSEISVMSTIMGDDIVKTYKNATQYYATFIDGNGDYLPNGTEVTFNINGVMYKRYVNGSEGKARLNINLSPGTYILTAINPVNGEMISNTVTVLSNFANNTDLVKYYKNDSQYVVTVLGSDGKVVGAGENVTFNINGVMYTRQTNESGQAKLNINLGPGNYTITAIYNGAMVSNNIEVLPILITEDLTIKYGTSDQFIAKLVDGQGNPYPGQNVTFNIDGRMYDRPTDSDGVAALTIRPDAPVGQYLVTSSYKDFSVSNIIKIVP